MAKKPPIQLDFHSATPIYSQIVDQILAAIQSGELTEGDQLPTVREWATELRINFNTVARAYRILDEARIISTQRGRGTYIWSAPSKESAARLRSGTLSDLARQFLDEGLRQGGSLDELKRIFLEEWHNKIPLVNNQ